MFKNCAGINQITIAQPNGQDICFQYSEQNQNSKLTKTIIRDTLIAREIIIRDTLKALKIKLCDIN